MEIIIAVSTSTPITSLSCFDLKSKKFLFKQVSNKINNHLEDLDIFMQKCMSKNVKLDKILLDIGPGSMTGIKCGISYISSLSMSMNVPIETISSFDIARFDIKSKIYRSDQCVYIFSHANSFFVSDPKIGNTSLVIDQDKISNISGVFASKEDRCSLINSNKMCYLFSTNKKLFKERNVGDTIKANYVTRFVTTSTNKNS